MHKNKNLYKACGKRTKHEKKNIVKTVIAPRLVKNEMDKDVFVEIDDKENKKIDSYVELCNNLRESKLRRKYELIKIWENYYHEVLGKCFYFLKSNQEFDWVTYDDFVETIYSCTKGFYNIYYRQHIRPLI